MYAIVEIGGHQYKVAENDVLFVDKQNADSDSVTFDNVPFTFHLTNDVQEFGAVGADPSGNLLYKFEFDVEETV